VRERLRVYEEKTRKPVSGFYSYTGLIRTVDADGDIDVVTQRLFDTLKAGTSRKPAKSAGAAQRRATKRRAPAKPKARGRRVVRKAKPKSAKPAAPKRRTAAKKRKVVRKAARPVRARRKSKR
jgi:hypothetical protein